MTAVDNSIIQKTQDTLGKYVTRPSLSEKLLNKPPFKFLRDVLKSVINENGAFQGLYSDEELSQDNIKDKDSKVAFLQKCIDATIFATGDDISVRPSKIVAGHEADKTNEWLQGIGKILENQIDTSEAVQLVISGKKPEKKKTSKKPKSKDGKSSSKDGGESSKTSKDRKSKSEAENNSKNKEKSGSKSKKDKKDKKRAKEKTPSVPPTDGGETSGTSRPLDEVITDNVIAESTQEDAQPPLVNGHVSPTEDIQSSLPPSSLQPEIHPGSVHSPQDDPGIGSGPASLLQLEGVDPSVGNEDQDGSHPAVQNFNDVDPAIIKAMAPNEDSDQRGVTSEQPDSGVGSLGSPKEPDKTSDPPPVSPPEDAPLGHDPPPLRALEHFDGTTVPVDPPLDTQPDDNVVERPKTGSGMRPRTGLRSARPPSARPAPPRVRERKEIPKEEIPRPPTSKPVANVILDSKADNDADDDGFMVEDKPILDDENMDIGSGEGLSAEQQQMVEEGGEGAGLLVAQILDTKKDLEDGRKAAFSPETPGHRRVQFEESIQSEAARRKEREVIQKDVQKLSQSIQTLTRSVNPLAKMLDYLQEDLDSMQKELETWRTENKTLAQTLKREHNQTDISLEPLKVQLEDLDNSIYDQQDKISAVKSSIVRNSERIGKLMAGINT